MTIEFEGVVYGLVPEGFNPMPQPVCQKFITANLVEIWDEKITENDIDFDSQFGQWIASESEQMAEQFEIAEANYNTFDPDLASDNALDKVGRVVGVKRNAGNFTKVEVLCEGTIGTVIVVGNLVSIPPATEDDKKILFKSLEEFEIEAGGTSAVFEATERGAVKVFAGQISVIETTIVGWTGATNPEDGIIGSAVELNSAFRVRRQEHIIAGGSGRVDAIRFAVLNVEGVTSAKVYENDKDQTDERGQPKRSVEVIVSGGEDSDIAQALWDNKPGATPYVGNVSYDITDSQGFTHTMKFSRVALVPIYVIYEIEIDENFPSTGENTIKTNTVERGDALGIAEDVIVDPFLKGNLADVKGIVSNIIKVGLSPSPTLSDNIPISDTEKADFDTSRTVLVFL